MNCFIELLDPKLLDDHSLLLKEIDEIRLSLGLDIGWHYPLDLIWILKNLDLPYKEAVILDAGAGKGLLQFALAEHGYQVISVDFSKRLLQVPIRIAYPIRTLKGDLTSGEYLDHMQSVYTREVTRLRALLVSFRRFTQKARRFLVAMTRLPFFLYKRRKRQPPTGGILIYQSNILNMPYVEDTSVDAVVSVSVIEHLDKSEIARTIREFRRVLKPGGVIVLTTNAAKDLDWYHEPSMGWCFTEHSIRELLRIDQICPSNWDKFDSIFHKVRSSLELQQRISPAFALSGNNGMPWGIWDPQYIPVGIFIRMP